MASVDDAGRTALSTAATALAEVLRGLERTGMRGAPLRVWALALDEERTHWRLEALKGPNRGRAPSPRRSAACLFAIPIGTSCRAYGAEGRSPGPSGLTPIRPNREMLFDVRSEP